MKWNILVGSLVLGLGLCTQSFGFELLDRMLGVHGSGCHVDCCPAPCPKVKCPAPCPPKVKCPAPCPPKCACPPKVKCPPKCACPSKLACPPKCGCPSQAKCPPKCPPKCACPPAKAKCCAPVQHCRVGLLDRLFACHQPCKPACKPACPPVCGCDVIGVPGDDVNGIEDNDELAPMPPAPVVDPSAYVPSQRRVVHASSNLMR